MSMSRVPCSTSDLESVMLEPFLYDDRQEATRSPVECQGVTGVGVVSRAVVFHGLLGWRPSAAATSACFSSPTGCWAIADKGADQNAAGPSRPFWRPQ